MFNPSKASQAAGGLRWNRDTVNCSNYVGIVRPGEAQSATFAHVDPNHKCTRPLTTPSSFTARKRFVYIIRRSDRTMDPYTIWHLMPADELRTDRSFPSFDDSTRHIPPHLAWIGRKDKSHDSLVEESLRLRLLSDCATVVETLHHEY